MTRISEDVTGHVLEPVERSLGPTMPTFTASEGRIRSVAATLLAALLPATSDGTKLPATSEDAERYQAGVAALTGIRHSTDIRPYVVALLDRLTTDDRLPALEVGDLLVRLTTHHRPTLADPFLRCCLAHLGRDGVADNAFASVVGLVIANLDPATTDPVLVVDACVQLREKGLDSPLTTAVLIERAEAPQVLRSRPDLPVRARALDAFPPPL